MYAQKLEAYGNAQKEVVNGRELEALVLNRAAMKLKVCQDNWDAKDRDDRLIEALKYNQSVWSIFQSELAKPENPLPGELKQNILSLSLFVDKRIIDVMSFPSPEKLDIIININRNIAAGLNAA